MSDLSNNEQLNARERGYVRMRSIMDLGMGVLWTAMGFFLVFIKKFDTNLILRFDASTLQIFGVVCLVYGIFRIYRGVKKKYLRER